MYVHCPFGTFACAQSSGRPLNPVLLVFMKTSLHRNDCYATGH